MAIVFLFTENCALITIEQALAKNQFCSNLEQEKNTTMFFILEEAKETNFYKEP